MSKYKKPFLITVVFLSLLLRSYYVSSDETGGTIMPGDINGDGTRNVSDVVTVLQVVTGMTPQELHLAADLDGNGMIGMEEALNLLSIFRSGLDARPDNQTCLAEELHPQILVEDVFQGVSFQSPTTMVQVVGDDTRFYIAEKGGSIQLLVNGTKQATPFLNISSRLSIGSEKGLLGLAFHPDYDMNGYFFVSYTNTSNMSIVSRFTRSSNPNIADSGSERAILSLSQPYNNHNGGNIAFGPDGYLYVGFGDGGSGGDPLNHAQDVSTWFGAMLRIDIDGESSYSIPADNPFSGQTCSQPARTGTCPEIYAYGLRNPWRWSFDQETEALWLGDVGQNEVEEIDIISSGSNYGWRCFEGTEVYNSSGCSSINAVPPVTQYTHTRGRCSVTGGYVYRGSAITSLYGSYIYGDYCTGEIWRLPVSDLQQTPELLTRAPANIYSFAEDNAGNIYVLMSNGKVGLIAFDPNGGGVDPIPSLLSQTGCVDQNDPTLPAAGLIPYDINAPFWSDGAQKTRWLALPNSEQINNDSQDWIFPPGTVLMKQFNVNGTLVETRLLKRHPNGAWAGYTYEWNEAETDAGRVIGGKTVSVDNGDSVQDWIFPSETECFSCHTSAAGYALGPEPAQLNKDFIYTQTGRSANQLITIRDIGLLLNDLGGEPQSLPQLTNPYDKAEPLESRARSWLHSNCSGCHRPNGSTNSSMDVLYSTQLDETNACNTDANVTGPGWPTVLLVPGEASASLLYYRVNSRDSVIQMPPTGTTVIDPEGVLLLEQWINSLSDCSSSQ